MPVRFTLFFSKHFLEYDIYSLLKAFWPQAEITICYTEPDADDSVTACRVIYAEEEGGVCGVTFSIEVPEGETAASLGVKQAGFFEKTIPVAAGSSTLHIKNKAKQLVYGMLTELTGTVLPWGDLTGIRPVSLVSGMLEEGLSDGEVLEHMKTEWFVSDEKCRLALETAKREKALLQEVRPEEGWSLYIGIPFCPSICLYCSFGSHPLDRWQKCVDEYLQALQKELTALAGMMTGRRLDTIYVGGGTPTSLTAGQMEELLGTVSRLFSVRQVHEFTVEAGRPDTITREKLDVLKRYAVSRISVNPQTMNEETLVRIGRKHTVRETEEAFALARECGFDNINMDLIVGLPGEGEREVARTLEKIRELSPDSLTVHSLALKRATRLHLFREEYEKDSFVNSGRIMQMAEECARSMEMHPYYLYRQKNIAGNFENTGYSKDGKEGLYNILIMEQRQPILAAGSGASTKLFGEGGRIIRVENVKDLTQYLARVDEMIEKKRAALEEQFSGDG